MILRNCVIFLIRFDSIYFNLEMESVSVCSVPLIFLKQFYSISTNPDHQTLHHQPTIQECYLPYKLLGLILQNHSTALGKTSCLRLLLKEEKVIFKKVFSREK